MVVDYLKISRLNRVAIAARGLRLDNPKLGRTIVGLLITVLHFSCKFTYGPLGLLEASQLENGLISLHANYEHTPR